MTMREPPRTLLDSYAILAFLADEDGAATVADLLSEAVRTGAPLLVNEINVGEVYYVVACHRSMADADRVLDHLETLPLEVVGNAFDDVLEAARIKARFPLSYADAFAVATAVRFGATVVTGDGAFRAVEDLVGVMWL